jgi:ubiquinone biosynthesis protein
VLGAIGDLARLARAGFVMTHEGLLAFVPAADLPPMARWFVRLARTIEKRAVHADSRAARLSAAFARLGPSWIKLGQFLATRPDVVGADVARDLETLQDRLPPFDARLAEAAVEAALGRPLGELFARFGPPVAAASIAQVHRATVRDGGAERDVAVKVLRPGVQRRFGRDLEAYYTAARLIERFVPATRRLKPVGVVDTLAHSVALEMDLRLEAAAISELAENTREDIGFRLPRVEWDRTAKTVLTTEWIDGVPLSDVERLRRDGHDLPALAATVIQSFLRQAMRDGFFHADMHQGNLFVDRTGTLVAVDCGIMGRLNRRERRFLALILWSFIRRDYRQGAEVHFEAGYVPRSKSVDSFAQALRAIGEPIHEKTADEISMARLLTQLFEMTELFAMETRLELVMLQKTMVVVEGVGRSLDPKLDMWRTAEPVVSEYIRRELGPAGAAEAAKLSGERLWRLLADAPDLIRRAEGVAADLSAAAERGFRLAPETVEAIAEAEVRRTKGQETALWVIAFLLAAIAAKLVLG